MSSNSNGRNEKRPTERKMILSNTYRFPYTEEEDKILSKWKGNHFQYHVDLTDNELVIKTYVSEQKVEVDPVPVAPVGKIKRQRNSESVATVTSEATTDNDMEDDEVKRRLEHEIYGSVFPASKKFRSSKIILSTNEKGQ